jgi:S1-C subfamily serine protease
VGQPVDPAPAPWWRRLYDLRTHARSVALFAAGILAALLGLLLYATLTPDPVQLTPVDLDASIADALASVTPAPALAARVYDVIRPSLVLIQTEREGEEREGRYGIGSGVVVNADGDILTSLHVVSDSVDIEVTFADGTQARAMIAVAQPENDIAVLRAAQLPLQVVPATLGNPGAMRVGDDAFVVGNPLGLYGSLTAGVVSGLGRSFQPMDSEARLTDLIQIDAAVNPGNSGGPLLNRYGQVVGVVTGLANPTEEDVFIGIGFAVPIDVAGAAAGMPPY